MDFLKYARAVDKNNGCEINVKTFSVHNNIDKYGIIKNHQLQLKCVSSFLIKSILESPHIRLEKL